MAARDTTTSLPDLGLDPRREALVVLHVAGGLLFGTKVVFELGEQLFVAFVENVCQYVQATAVGHADGELIDTQVGPGLDHIGHGRDENLCTLQREALLSNILGVQEFFKQLGAIQMPQDGLFIVDGEVGSIERGLDFLFQPLDLLKVENVIKLDPHLRAIDGLEHIKDLAQGRLDFSIRPSVGNSRSISSGLKP